MLATADGSYLHVNMLDVSCGCLRDAFSERYAGGLSDGFRISGYESVEDPDGLGSAPARSGGRICLDARTRGGS